MQKVAACLDGETRRALRTMRYQRMGMKRVVGQLVSRGVQRVQFFEPGAEDWKVECAVTAHFTAEERDALRDVLANGDVQCPTLRVTL